MDGGRSACDCGALFICSKFDSLDPTFVGELPFDGRDVWHGAYAQVERFCASVLATQGSHHRLHIAVCGDACTRLFAFESVWTRCCLNGGRGSRGHLPGRHCE